MPSSRMNLGVEYAQPDLTHSTANDQHCRSWVPWGDQMPRTSASRALLHPRPALLHPLKHCQGDQLTSPPATVCLAPQSAGGRQHPDKPGKKIT